ncbi:MAG TPA: four-carbon acid sugar kinase family protein, partial [Agromyces mariniharenae]|nr:four-carbon acid sugar kinase family protein [Agromyces mariniharenae]
MKTIVLDDDPTGTQSATGVTVLLDFDAEILAEALATADAVYLQTNSRALPEDEAVALARRIRDDALAASARLGVDVRFVLRGDSTLRGHVFAESEVFLDGDAVMLFVPAFPDGGRTTRDGVHYVRVDGIDLPAHESEYAADPVFGFGTGVLVDYVAEKSGRAAVHVPLDDVRRGELGRILAEAPAGSVVLPDAVDDADIRLIAQATDAAMQRGSSVVVRSASPLAAELAGVASRGLLPAPLVEGDGPVLLACGSHTAGATAQLEAVVAEWGQPAVIETDAALADPAAAGHAAADAARAALADRPLAFVTTERDRSATHNTLAHGERVMTALTTAVQDLLPDVSVVVAKGGITSAEVARTGIGARSALVLGQVLPGVSAWRMASRDGREVLYIV